jgi:hypothetical protein
LLCEKNVKHFYWSYIFSTTIKAYNYGSRNRQRIFDQDFGDLRWHKTGKTRPIFLAEIQRGYKKIMVLYMTPSNGGKTEN